MFLSLDPELDDSETAESIEVEPTPLSGRPEPTAAQQVSTIINLASVCVCVCF